MGQNPKRVIYKARSVQAYLRNGKRAACHHQVYMDACGMLPKARKKRL